MQEIALNPKGQWLCQADNCKAVATHGWERAARVDQGDFNGDTVPVYGCDPHKLSDDEAAKMHQASCLAPPACTCEPIAGPRRESGS